MQRPGSVLAMFFLGLVLGTPARVATATELGTRGTRFTIDGTPRFLLGISAYSALGEPDESLQRDLDEMARRGYNWMRVWATWAAFQNDVSAVETDGQPRQPYLERLRSLLREADRRGIVVDVTLSRGNGVTGPPRLQERDDLARAVETLVIELKPLRNWYLDLSNEHNINDKRHTGFQELKLLRELVRQVDPDRLVTVSHAGDIPLDELKFYVDTAGVDFITPHRPRTEASAAQTEQQTKAYLQAMKDLSRVVPVHYQEPFRRGFARWEPELDDYLTDLRGALKGGAAGWCLHNGDQRLDPEGRPRRSFDLRAHGLFEGLDPVEARAAEQLPTLTDPRGHAQEPKPAGEFQPTPIPESTPGDPR